MAINYLPQTTGVAPAMTPANASGANFTPAIGQAEEHLGQEGARVAGDFNRIQYQQKEADDLTALKSNLTKGDEQFTDYMEQQKSQVPVNGAGYVDKFREAFDPWSQQVIDQQTSPRLKRIAAEQVASMHNRFYGQASQWQVNTNRAWRRTTFDDSITQSGARVQQDPGAYDDELKDQLQTIDALSGELHPEDKIALTQRARKTLAEAASLGFVQKAPQQAVGILGGEQPLPEGSTQAKIVAAATKYKVDPATLLAQKQLETPNDEIGNGGGAFQFVPQTAQQYGLTNPQDTDANIDAAARLTADNTKTLRKSLGRDPTPYDVRMAHWFGPGGALAMLKSPDTTTVQAATNLSPEDLAKNGLNTRSTVGDVKHLVQVNMDKALNDVQQYANAPAPGEGASTDTMPAYFKELSPEGRQAMLTHAQGLMRKDQTVERAQLSQKFGDASAAWERGQSADAPGLAEWQHAYGPQLGLIHYQKQVALQDFGAQYAKVATASPQEQAAIYAQSSGSTTAEGMKLHDAMGQAINQANAERAADPIAFDQVKGMKITQPIDWQDQEHLTQNLAVRFSNADQLSQKFGTSYQPLSKQEALNLGNFVANAKPTDVQNYLGAMRIAAGNKPEQYTALLGQIAPNQPIIAHAGAIADQNPQAAAMMLQGQKLLHPPGEKKESTIVMPQDGGVGGFRQAWQTMGAPQAYGINQQSEDASFQAAKAYYVAAQEPSKRDEKNIDPTLWKKAVDVATGGMADAGNGAKTLPPYGMKPEDFPGAVAQVWSGAMMQHGLDPKEHPQNAYTLQAIGNGIYGVTSGTSSLRGSDGQPVIFDLIRGSATQPQTPPSTPVQISTKKPPKLTVDDLRRFGR